MPQRRHEHKPVRFVLLAENVQCFNANFNGGYIWAVRGNNKSLFNHDMAELKLVTIANNSNNY